MTREEFTSFEQELKDKGYRKYKGLNLDCEDFYYCKSFGKGDNMHDEDRSNYQLLFKVYDFEKYAFRMCIINPIGITPVIMISRIIDERLDFELHGSVKETNINQIETLAESFFAWVEKNIQI